MSIWDIETPRPTFRTQKARGVDFIRNYGLFSSYGLDAHYQAPDFMSIWPHSSDFRLPCFARPCPTVPRHGFVESRVVTNGAEVAGIIAEMQRQDPNGEIIFMPRLTGRYSGVATHAGVSFGFGNDGATGGTSAKHIPSYVSPAQWNTAAARNWFKKAGINGTGYVEFVEHKDDLVFVQFRDGPEIPRSVNFIPHATEVKTVVRAEGELLDWETFIATADKNAGLVVWHPNGCLSSHYAVHCMIHGIPVVIDHEPKRGETLEPTTWQPPKLAKADYALLANMLEHRLNAGYNRMEIANDQKAICHTAVGTLHSHMTWDNDPHLMRLRAEGLAGMLNFTAAACIGEDRHFYQAGPGRVSIEGDMPENPGTGCGCSSCRRKYAAYRVELEKWREREIKLPPGATVANCTLVRETYKHKPERHEVFEQVLALPVGTVLPELKNATEDFAMPWRQGFGGRNWHDAAATCVKGFEKTQDFIREPSAAHWKLVLTQYNNLVNAVHNGGKVLNKWISQDGMDWAAHTPGPMFINKFAGRLALGI